MQSRIVVLFVLLGLCGELSLAEENVKLCKQASTFGYEYSKLYEIKSDVAKHNGSGLRFDFLVKAKSDAHVLLSSTSVLQDPGGAYEVVLGGGKNTFSQIRLWKKGTKVNAGTPDILSSIEYRGFWIQVNQSRGSIEVGQKGIDDPILFWLDNKQFPIKYFSLSTWTDVKGEWLFGCPDLALPELNEDFGVPVVKKLKTDLLSFYDPYIVPSAPNQTLKVEAKIRIHNIHLDERSALLTVDGVMPLKWTDYKIRWQPGNYSDLDTLYLTPFDVWTPNVMVFNGMANLPMFNLNQVGVVAKSNGSMFWNPPLHFASYCGINIVNWPHDVHNCSIFMGFFLESHNLVFEITGKTMVIYDRGGPEWEVVNVSTRPGSSDKTLWIADVVIRRRHQGDLFLLISPFIATAILVMSALWLSPDQPGQLPLSCMSMMILVLMTLEICERIPVMQESVPNIVLLYTWAILANCVPILLFVALKNLPPTFLFPEALHDVLVKIMSSEEDLSIYSQLQEPRQSEAEEKPGPRGKASRRPASTILVATAIQRIFCVLYFIVFAYIFTLTS